MLMADSSVLISAHQKEWVSLSLRLLVAQGEAKNLGLLYYKAFIAITPLFHP
jgi:hypothetical protein